MVLGYLSEERPRLLRQAQHPTDRLFMTLRGGEGLRQVQASAGHK